MLEEGGRAVNTFFDALKSQPLSLALVVMNFTLLAFLYFFGVASLEERKRETELLYRNRSEVAQLLARCNIQEEK